MILKTLLAQQWAMQRDALQKMYDIALQHKNNNFDAVQLKSGEPLKNTIETTVRDGVAIIPVTGPIFRYANLFTAMCGATSIEIFAQELNTAVENPDVKAIILDIDSPGGQVSGIHELAETIYNFRDTKPIKAYVGSLAASAGYFIASAADEIIIDAMGQAGSIGVVTTLYTNKDENSVEIVSSKSPNKRPDFSTEEGKSKVQGLIDEMADVFIDRVAKYRNMTAEAVVKAGDFGGVRIGTSAVNAGLADRLGNMEDLIKELSEKEDATMVVKRGATTGKSEEDMSGKEKELSPDTVKADYPEIAEALKKEGAKDERDRIKAVEDASITGAEDLIAELKYDGKTTGPEAAAKVLQKMKTAGNDILASLKDEAPRTVKGSEDDKQTAQANLENYMIESAGGKKNE